MKKLEHNLLIPALLCGSTLWLANCSDQANSSKKHHARDVSGLNVTNGQDAKNLYPAVVQLFSFEKDVDPSSPEFGAMSSICSGTVIAPSKVMTTADCACKGITWLGYGKPEMRDEDALDDISAPIRVAIHPGYSCEEAAASNDWAPRPNVAVLEYPTEVGTYYNSWADLSDEKVVTTEDVTWMVGYGDVSFRYWSKEMKELGAFTNGSGKKRAGINQVAGVSSNNMYFFVARDSPELDFDVLDIEFGDGLFSTPANGDAGGAVYINWFLAGIMEAATPDLGAILNINHQDIRGFIDQEKSRPLAGDFHITSAGGVATRAYYVLSPIDKACEQLCKSHYNKFQMSDVESDKPHLYEAYGLMREISDMFYDLQSRTSLGEDIDGFELIFVKILANEKLNKARGLVQKAYENGEMASGFGPLAEDFDLFSRAVNSSINNW